MQRVKENIATSHIQIILLTAKSGDDSQVGSYHKGADFYIEKPFHSAALRKQVHNLIHSREKLGNHLDAKLLGRIDTIIKKNLAMEKLSVKELTAEVDISRTQLHLKLKSQVGMSATEYINHLRLKESVTLMQSGCRISEAAYATGFSSPNYSKRLFLRKFGMSPSNYLKKHSGREGPKAAHHK